MKKEYIIYSVDKIEEVSITVDYSMPLIKMIEACVTRRRNENINEKNFPIEGEGKENINLVVVGFVRRENYGNEVLVELKKMNMQPVMLPQLLAFGAKFPKKQEEFSEGFSSNKDQTPTSGENRV